MGRSSLHRPGGQGVDERTAAGGDFLDMHLEAGPEGVRLHVQERLRTTPVRLSLTVIPPSLSWLTVSGLGAICAS